MPTIQQQLAPDNNSPLLLITLREAFPLLHFHDRLRLKWSEDPNAFLSRNMARLMKMYKSTITNKE